MFALVLLVFTAFAFLILFQDLIYSKHFNQVYKELDDLDNRYYILVEHIEDVLGCKDDN